MPRAPCSRYTKTLNTGFVQGLCDLLRPLYGVFNFISLFQKSGLLGSPLGLAIIIMQDAGDIMHAHSSTSCSATAADAATQVVERRCTAAEAAE